MKKPTIASKIEKHWTVLLVDGQGRIRRIPHFRRNLWIIAGFTAGALILTVFMAFLYGGSLLRHKTLSDELNVLQGKLVAMRQENELLKARVVRMETLAANPESGPGRRAETAPATPARAAATPAPEPPAVAAPPASGTKAARLPAAAPENQTAAASEPQKKPQVDAEGLKLAFRPDDEIIEAKFVIKNTGQVPASGRAVVVLHTKEGPSQVHLALPAVPMKDGRPVGGQGRRFSINHYMTLTVDRKFAEPGTRFAGAVVYAYTLEGKPLLEKPLDVTLDIPAEEPVPNPAPIAAPLGLNLPEPEPQIGPGVQP